MRREVADPQFSRPALPACDNSAAAAATHTRSRSAAQEQEQLHKLDALNLAIALKRAIYDAGYTCKRVTDAGFVGEWKNLDMWMAHCVYDDGTAAGLGDLRRARRQRPGARLQGHSGQRPARLQDQASGRRAALPRPNRA